MTFFRFFVSDSLSLEQVPETGRWRFMDVSPKFEAAVRALPSLVSPHLVTYLTSISSGKHPMTNSPESTVKSSSHLPTSLHSTVTVSSPEFLRQTTSVHFAAIDVYPLPRGAYCSRHLEWAMASPKRQSRICGIRILLRKARRMALETRSGTC